MTPALLKSPIEDAKLKEVNSRLIKGQGWIGYRYSKSSTGERIRSRFLYLKFYVNGTPKAILTDTNDPEEAYRQLIEAHKETNEGNRLPQEVARLRYEDLITLLVEDYRARGVASLYTRKTKDGNVEETFGGKDDLDTFFRRLPILQITSLKIDAFTKSQLKQGYSSGSVRRQLVFLQAAFAIAKSKDLITDAHIPTFNMPKDSEAREGFLEIKEFDKFLAAFPNNLQPTVLFLYYSGCRSGAAAQITWGMVNADCTEIHAPGRIIKNKSDWEIPLVGPLEPIAKALKRVRGKSIKDADAPVFDFTNFRRIWNQTCHDLKLGKYVTEKEDGAPTQQYTGLHAHDFRRSAARNLIKAGVSEQVAMKITGHKTASIFRRYAIQNGDDVKAALIAVGKRKGVTVAGKAGK